MLVAFLGLCAGMSGGFHWANPLFSLLLVPVIWRHISVLYLVLGLALGWILRPELTTRILVPGGEFVGKAHVVTVATTERDNQNLIVDAGGNKYRLRLPGNSTVNLGDTIHIRADIVKLPDRAMANHMEVASLRPTKPVEVVRSGFIGWKIANSFRLSFVQFVMNNTNPNLTGLVQAICLNVNGDIGFTLFDDLRRTGTVHIVTASGLHCMIVATFLAVLLLRVPIHRVGQLIILVVFLFFYAAAAGFHPPIIRATITVLLASFAYVFRREPDGISALSAAGIVTLLMAPESIGEVGFQLSNIAVMSLLMFSAWPNETSTALESSLQNALRLAQSNLLVTSVLAPIIAYHFGMFSVVSIIANLLVVPVIPFAVLGAMGAFGLSFAPPFSFLLMRFIVEPQTGWILFCVESLSRLPWAVLEVPNFSAYWLIVIYALIAMLWTFKKRPANFTGW